MDLQKYVQWNLQDVINFMTEKDPNILSVYIFGSRAHRTNSFRSDIDIIVYSIVPVQWNKILSGLREDFEPVDVFESIGGAWAKSIINGSIINSPDTPVWSKVGAKLLWERESGFIPSSDCFIQHTITGADFKMSIIDSDESHTFSAKYYHTIQTSRIPDTQIGFSWKEIAVKFSKITKRCFLALGDITDSRAKAINTTAMKICNEYDMQHLIYICMKPWFPSLQHNPFMIRYGSVNKHADFSIDGNSIVVETKLIHDANTEGAVLKTLQGLGDFYSINPGVKCLIFIVLVDTDHRFDTKKLEYDFSDIEASPVRLLKVIKHKIVK